MSAIPSVSRRGLFRFDWLAQAARTAPRPPRVDAAGCLARTGCAVCVERCPVPGALAFGADAGALAPAIDPAACDRCGRCVAVCPAPRPCIDLGDPDRSAA